MKNFFFGSYTKKKGIGGDDGEKIFSRPALDDIRRADDRGGAAQLSASRRHPERRRGAVWNCAPFSAFSDFAVYFGTRGIRDGAWWMLFDGAATLLLALLLLFGSSRIVRSLPLLLGAWLLISGLSRTANALRLRSFGSDDWSWVLGCGALMGFCGLLFLFAPLAGLTAIGAVLGFALFLVGTVILLGAYLANRFW